MTVGAGGGSTKLKPVTVNVTLAPAGDVASATTASGTFSSGGRFVAIGVTVKVVGPIVRVAVASVI